MIIYKWVTQVNWVFVLFLLQTNISEHRQWMLEVPFCFLQHPGWLVFFPVNSGSVHGMHWIRERTIFDLTCGTSFTQSAFFDFSQRHDSHKALMYIAEFTDCFCNAVCGHVIHPYWSIYYQLNRFLKCLFKISANLVSSFPSLFFLSLF